MFTLVILYTLYTYVECSGSAFLKMAHHSHFESIYYKLTIGHTGKLCGLPVPLLTAFP